MSYELRNEIRERNRGSDVYWEATASFEASSELNCERVAAASLLVVIAHLARGPREGRSIQAGRRRAGSMVPEASLMQLRVPPLANFRPERPCQELSHQPIPS